MTATITVVDGIVVSSKYPRHNNICAPISAAKAVASELEKDAGKEILAGKQKPQQAWRNMLTVVYELESCTQQKGLVARNPKSWGTSRRHFYNVKRRRYRTVMSNFEIPRIYQVTLRSAKNVFSASAATNTALSGCHLYMPSCKTKRQPLIRLHLRRSESDGTCWT